MLSRYIIAAFLVGGLFSSCDFDRNKPGYTYFPDMEESQAFETYSSNTVFKDGKTNRLPVDKTIARGKIPYRFEKTEENLLIAGNELVNPYVDDDSVVEDGKQLYQIYCTTCHGDMGDGNGTLYVSGKYPFPPASLLTERAVNRKDGELFHIISIGFGVMGAHQSQINTEERWKIISYIRELQ